ncbi:MAG TPA: hypothetical protein P5572_08750 [Phycisphaerae bacterium]|nr:hypothetical protein [Phycisphaerae bacterium]
MKRMRRMAFYAMVVGGTLCGFLPGCVEERILNLVTPLFIY